MSNNKKYQNLPIKPCLRKRGKKRAVRTSLQEALGESLFEVDASDSLEGDHGPMEAPDVLHHQHDLVLVQTCRHIGRLQVAALGRGVSDPFSSYKARGRNEAKRK